MSSHPLHETVLDTISRNADKPFLIDATRDAAYSYRVFHERACDLAGLMLARGAKHGDRVAILSKNSAEFVAFYFACLYLGVCAVPMNPAMHENDIRYLLEHCGIQHLCYSSESRRLIEPLVDRFGFCLFLEDTDGAPPGSCVWSMQASPEHQASCRWEPFTDVDPSALLSVTFTSGTTDRPKGVAHRAETLLSNAMAFNRAMSFDDSLRMCHLFSMSYMAGFLNTLLCPFIAGGTVVITEGFGARLALHFWDIALKYGVNSIWASPTMLQALLRLDRSPTGRDYCRHHLRTICVGTAPLPARLKSTFETHYDVALCESYGLSELLIVTTSSRSSGFRAGTVGQPLENVQIKVVDESSRILPHGQHGEILVHTPNLMAGYLDTCSGLVEPLASPEWYPTGDIGHLSGDGTLSITDRKKDLIIRGGINISPCSIEAVLESHDAVIQASVVGLPQDFYGEEVVAALRLVDGKDLACIQPSLLQLCKEHLAEYSIPTRFFALTAFPLTTTGKIHKKRLSTLLGDTEPLPTVHSVE